MDDAAQRPLNVLGDMSRQASDGDAVLLGDGGGERRRGADRGRFQRRVRGYRRGKGVLCPLRVVRSGTVPQRDSIAFTFTIEGSVRFERLRDNP